MSMSAITNRLIGSILGIGSALAFAQSALYDVRGGYHAVIFDRIKGVRANVVGEGTHILVPWLQRAIIFDSRARPRNITTTTGSRDLQMVTLTLRVLHRPDIPYLPRIYQLLGQDYEERVLPSIGNEVLKAVVAQFEASELITQRETVSKRICEELLSRAAKFHILLEDVSITHLTFGTGFTKAVEHKQIAQQEAERAKFVVEKSEFEKQAAIVRAEGHAKAAEIVSAALHKAGPALVQFRRIEAAKEIAASLADGSNVTYLPTTTGSSGNGSQSNTGLLLGIGINDK